MWLTTIDLNHSAASGSSNCAVDSQLSETKITNLREFLTWDCEVTQDYQAELHQCLHWCFNAVMGSFDVLCFLIKLRLSFNGKVDTQIVIIFSTFELEARFIDNRNDQSK